MDKLFAAVADELDAWVEAGNTFGTNSTSRGVGRFYDDPVKFAEVCINWPPGKSLTPYQSEILSEIPVRKRVSVRGPHGLGKAVRVDTSIPTPIGWSAVGELRVGDQVFDEQGKPCTVTWKSEVFHTDTYRVTFADGSTLTTHGRHEWHAVNVTARPKGIADWRDHWGVTQQVTTEQMYANLRTPGGQLRWRVPTARSLNLPTVDLPIDPYLLGVWLGDGTTDDGTITLNREDLADVAPLLGPGHIVPSTERHRAVRYRPDGLRVALRHAGLLGRKHIPMAYLRASTEQRIELVRGLWDSDGYRQAGGGSDEITLTNQRLAADVVELLGTLGLVVRVKQDRAQLNGRDMGPRWRIGVRFDFNPYHLTRYDWRPLGDQASRHTQRTITNIERVPDAPTQCIEVDSPSHLFLAGRSFIPTHNSTTSAIAVLWFALTRDAVGRDWKCVTTAGAWRQLIQYLWPEIHKWARLLNWEEIGRPEFNTHNELLTLNLKLRYGAAFAVASDKAELIEGAHGDSIMYIFDESKVVSAATFDAAEGAFSGASEESGIEAFALAMSTPGEPNGRFYDIHTRKKGLEKWWARHVTKHEAIAAGRVSREWCDEMHALWGDSAVYYNKVEGDFHSADEDGVIPSSWLDAAFQRWKDWDAAGRPLDTELTEGRRTLGVDVARDGQDRTVLAPRLGNLIVELRDFAKQDTMQTVGHVIACTNNPDYSGMMPVVDVIGIGAGVVDRLREQEYTVEAFNASEGTTRKDITHEFGFVNCRSAAYWGLREALDPARDPTLALPPHDMLIGDLTSPKWKATSGGKIQVESKDDIKKRIRRSTDYGDAVIMAWWPMSMEWRKEYGVIVCENCRTPFMSELHPQRCPRCQRSWRDEPVPVGAAA